MRDRRVFMTEKGYSGAAPVSMKVGNRVCLLLVVRCRLLLGLRATFIDWLGNAISMGYGG